VNKINIDIKKVTYGNKSVLEHLVQFYSYDLSEYTEFDINKKGYLLSIF